MSAEKNLHITTLGEMATRIPSDLLMQAVSGVEKELAAKDARILQLHAAMDKAIERLDFQKRMMLSQQGDTDLLQELRASQNCAPGVKACFACRGSGVADRQTVECGRCEGDGYLDEEPGNKP